jgi:AcrR family transcriptional regulator
VVDIVDKDSEADDHLDEEHPGDELARLEPDGRRRRRVQNREAVVDALLDLYRDGNLRPGTDEIAERAGLSPRSLFRYFDDVDDLASAAVTRQQIRALPLAAIIATPEDPFRTKVDALVEQRFRVFQEVGQAAKVVRLRAPFQPVLARELGQTRAFFRHQIVELFEPELGRMGPARAPGAVAAADVLTSFESFQLFRHEEGLSLTDAAAAMVRAVALVLDPGSP